MTEWAFVIFMVWEGKQMRKNKKIWNDSCFERYSFGLLIAIELLMSFTNLGYIHVPPISVTTAYIPIFIAACLYGPRQSVIVAFIFGTASMYKASASYVMPADAIFSPILSGLPINSILLSVGTRMLFGLLVGIAFAAAKRSSHSRFWMGALSAVFPKVHSLFVYTGMGLLFPELGYHYYSAFHWKPNDVVIVITCVTAVEIILAISQRNAIRNVKQYINQSINNPYTPKKIYVLFAVFEFFLFCMAAFAAFYFSQRESYMLERHGVSVSSSMSYDMLHLQIQFLIALLSLMVITIIVLILIYKYMLYKEYKGEMDELTGIMGRRMFLYYCEKVQKAGGTEKHRMGWFLFVDVDYFKAINDTFGHSVGDKVLREIAMNLQSILGNNGKVGRIGGDEFAVIIEKPMAQQELKQQLEQFQQSISGILDDKKVSCSIGAYQFAFPQNVRDLLEETDKVLYKAKENGRACYVVKEYTARQPAALWEDGNE